VQGRRRCAAGVRRSGATASCAGEQGGREVAVCQLAVFWQGAIIVGSG